LPLLLAVERLLSVSSPDQVLAPSLRSTVTAEASGVADGDAGCKGGADFESNKKHHQKAANADG